MKTLEVKLFSYDELSDDAKKKVIENKIESAQNDPYLLEHVYSEIQDSIEKIAEACNLRVRDYSYGSYCRDHKLVVENYDVEDLEGGRALAWFLRILINHGYPRPKHFSDMKFDGICGFTGWWCDEDIVECVWNSLLSGATVKRAFDDVSERLCDICEAESEYLTSEECIMEYLDESEEIYLEDGSEY